MKWIPGFGTLEYPYLGIKNVKIQKIKFHILSVFPAEQPERHQGSPAENRTIDDKFRHNPTPPPALSKGEDGRELQ